MSERFILFSGKREPWIYTDIPVNKLEAIQLVLTGEVYPTQVIAFDLEAGTSRDASIEIAAETIELWAKFGKPLTRQQYEYVELWTSTSKANAFAQAAE